MWNVNNRTISLLLLRTRELIETLWNVNEACAAGRREIHQELIETLWNVNIASNMCNAIVSLGINRNIVECKYRSTSRNGRSRKELIETLWNVNLFPPDVNVINS